MSEGNEVKDKVELSSTQSPPPTNQPKAKIPAYPLPTTPAVSNVNFNSNAKSKMVDRPGILALGWFVGGGG